jgi:hypothetical protein
VLIDFCRRIAASGTGGMAYPELVHAKKNSRIFCLKNVPKIEVRHGPVTGESLSESPAHMRVDIEPEKIQTVLTQKGADFGQRQLVFLNVKKQIAARARTKKIRIFRRPL